MADTSDLYRERLMDIKEDHTGWGQDFTKQPYDWTEQLYMLDPKKAAQVGTDFQTALGDFGKTDKKGFLQHALQDFSAGFGMNAEEMAGSFMPKGAVPNEVTATSATVNPSEMGGGLGGHTNVDNLFGYLTKDFDPVAVETAMQDSANTGLLDANPEMWT